MNVVKRISTKNSLKISVLRKIWRERLPIDHDCKDKCSENLKHVENLCCPYFYFLYVCACVYTSASIYACICVYVSREKHQGLGINFVAFLSLFF